MVREFKHPDIGQPCRVKGGGVVKGYIGMVVDWYDDFPKQEIHVKHPVTGVVKHYDPDNVELLSLHPFESSEPPETKTVKRWPDGYVIAKQAAIDNGDKRPDGSIRYDLMYAFFDGSAIYATEGEAIRAIHALNLPLGFVCMPISLLFPAEKDMT